MRTPISRVKQVRSTVGKLVMAIAFVSVFLGISPGQVFGDDRRHEGERHDRYRREYRSPVYVVPPPRVIYAPPPVVYALPPPSPGISLVVPIEIR
jgi:hypothetical protein